MSNSDRQERIPKTGFIALAIETKLNSLLNELEDSADQFYLLKWSGGRIPRGAILSGKEIGWTQNGFITSVDGEQLGHYVRLLEFGGEDGQEQQMIVYTVGDRTPNQTT